MNTGRTVFVVDDDSEFRDLIAAVARRKQLPVDSFSSGEEFLARYDATWNGCVVVDVRSERVSGFELLRTLKAKTASMPAVATAKDADIGLAVRAMQEGAYDFVAKPATSEVWEPAMEAALHADAQRQTRRQELAELHSRLATLTPEEVDIFRRLMAGNSNKQMSQDLDLGLRTVELRRANITRKMKAESAPDLVRMAILLDILKVQRSE
jgi:two-component system, LuxR family, response regulator FixJ